MLLCMLIAYLLLARVCMLLCMLLLADLLLGFGLGSRARCLPAGRWTWTWSRPRTSCMVASLSHQT
jgi:hypothetical protein